MRQPQKMFRYFQTIRRQIADELLSVFDHFVGLALKGVKEKFEVDLSSKRLYEYTIKNLYDQSTNQYHP